MLDFDSANGSNPRASLIINGTFLYGMTEYGGINDMGTIFKIMPDGSGYVKLLDFAGVANGAYPYGSLISAGTFLYGMTANGGTYDMGTLFKIMLDGSGYVKLLDFDSVNGSYPLGSLILDGTFLYGMTANGGTNDMGTIFKIMPDGSGYVKLLDFQGANGSNPNGSLIVDGAFFYGMTQFGGMHGMGTIFKFQDCVPPAITANATDTIVCSGTMVTLTGGGATSYSWTGGVIDGVPFTPLDTTIYTVTGTDTNDCSNTASLTIYVIDCSGIESEQNIYLHVYPNPTIGKINIACEKELKDATLT